MRHLLAATFIIAAHDADDAVDMVKGMKMFRKHPPIIENVIELGTTIISDGWGCVDTFEIEVTMGEEETCPKTPK